MRTLFFVQEKPKDFWHVETEEDCEVMLCGKNISIEPSSVKVSRIWNNRRCPDCWIIHEKMRRMIFQ